MNYNERLSGNEAIAFAMKQIDPDVMAAFPITPSTEIPQYFAQYVANGEVNTEFVPVESEHSSMSACIGAEAAGARAVTATSSAGLALMYEMMYVAASSRTPWASGTRGGFRFTRRTTRRPMTISSRPCPSESTPPSVCR